MEIVRCVMPDIQLEMLFLTFKKQLHLFCLLDVSWNISASHIISTPSAFEVILQFTCYINYWLTYLLSYLGVLLVISILWITHRLRNDLYCVGWGVKLYSIQSNLWVTVGHCSCQDSLIFTWFSRQIIFVIWLCTNVDWHWAPRVLLCM